jgi:adenine deaminase
VRIDSGASRTAGDGPGATPLHLGGRLVKVALGEEPPDLVVRAGSVFDSVSGEFLADRSLWICGERIARITPSSQAPVSAVETLEAGDLTLVPGLLDGHTHLNRIFVPEYVRALLPTGTTSAVLETMELGETGGVEAIELMVGALRGQPLRLFHTLPTLSGLTEDEEQAAPSATDFERLLADPDCLGLGEVYWSNALLPGRQGQRVRDYVARTLAAGKVVEGHTAGARGARLEAYYALGVSSCHEPIDVDEALALYRLGFFVMLRHGGIRRDLENLRPLFDLPLDFRKFALVTDSVDPERLATWGYLDQVVREALQLGIPAALVYRMASTNVAEHFRLDHVLGSLAPGRFADVVAIPGPQEFRPVFILVGGRPVYREGERLVQPRDVPVPDSLLKTVRVEADLLLDRFGPATLPLVGEVRVIEMVSNLVTREALLPAGELDGPDLVPVVAVERTRGEQAFRGFVKGQGLRDAAFATTMTWDSPDLLVLGRDLSGARTALRRLVAMGGGAVLAQGDRVIAEVAAPLTGVISLRPLGEVRRGLGELNAGLRRCGAVWDDPLLAIDTLTTPAIPQLRITHRGYVRLRDRALLPLLA